MGFLATFGRRLATRGDRDGRAAAIEPSILPSETLEDEVGAGRRERRLGVPREILDRGLAQKVLGGWLQNRHQVLVPLTFRLSRLDAVDIGLVMRFGAVALLNASAADDTARRVLERALREIDAGDRGLAAFDAALAAPEPLSALIGAVRRRELAPYAYAVTVMAADTRMPAGRLFADFVAARLDLPADAVRSIDRRYRR